jgi:hypothetical protein
MAELPQTLDKAVHAFQQSLDPAGHNVFGRTQPLDAARARDNDKRDQVMLSQSNQRARDTVTNWGTIADDQRDRLKALKASNALREKEFRDQHPDLAARTPIVIYSDQYVRRKAPLGIRSTE